MSEAALRAGVRRIRGNLSLPDGAVQQVEDAAAALQVLRSDLATRLSVGEQVGAEVVAVGRSEINGWLFDRTSAVSELLSVRPSARVDQLKESVPINRARVVEGAKMVSLFDFWRTDYEAKVLLANETVGTYVFGVAPVQMKIVDRKDLLLQGPPVGDEISLMRVWAPQCLEAAWRYWTTAMAHTVPFAPRHTSEDGLTTRQHQVLALLAADLSDEAVATALGISVRTVRSDVAGVLEVLGVKSRFAAGIRLHIWEESTTQETAR